MMSFPKLPPAIPRSGNWLSRSLFRTLLGLTGWRVKLADIPDEPKLLVVVAPHTSNWDWPVAIAVASSLGLKVSWLGKHTLFRQPYGWFFAWFGGIPVDRNAPAGVVGDVVRQFAQRRELVLGLAPEGTRQNVSRFRTGYHRMASEAEVPVVMAALDYPSRTVTLGERFVLTGDIDADTARLQERFARYRGRNDRRLAGG